MTLQKFAAAGLLLAGGAAVFRATAKEAILPHIDDSLEQEFIGLSGQYRPLLSIEDLFGISVDYRNDVPAIGFRWYQLFPPQDRSGVAEYQDYLGTLIAGEDREKKQYFKLSFAPKAVAARDFEDVFIAGHPWKDGVADVSKLTIERWSLSYPDGALIARRPKSSLGLRQAQPYQRCSVSIVGGTFTPIDELPPIHEDRSLLYSEAEFASMTAMAVDPDGRYLLVTLSEGTLHRIDLSDTTQIEVVGSVTSSPGLHSCQDLSFAEHALYGRICVASRGVLGDPALDGAGMRGDQARSVFVDTENDGTFENVLEIPDGSWKTSEVRDKSNWIDGFRVNVDAIFN